MKQGCNLCGYYTTMSFENGEFQWCEYCEETTDREMSRMFNLLQENILNRLGSLSGNNKEML